MRRGFSAFREALGSPKEWRRTASRWLVPSAVGGFALIRGVFLAGFLPAFQSPDEPTHFDYVQVLAERFVLPELGGLCGTGVSPEAQPLLSVSEPVFSHMELSMPPVAAFVTPRTDMASRYTRGCTYNSYYPPLYYMSAALGYRLKHSSALLTRIYFSRLVSVTWGVVAALAAYLAGLFWWGRRADAFLIALVYAAQPQLGSLFASINNDAALFTLATVAFAATAAVRVSGRPIAWLAVCSLAATLGVLSKLTFILYLPCIFAFAVAALGRSRWRWAVLAMVPAGLAAAGWVAHTYGIAAQRYSVTPISVSAPDYLFKFVLDPKRLQDVWVRMYWMKWGWLDTFLVQGWYLVLELILAFSVAGLVAGWRSLLARERLLVLLAAGTTGFAVLTLYAIEWRTLRGTGQTVIQGRYLLPLFVVHAAVTLTGLRAFSRKLRAAVDGAWVFAAVLLMVNAAAIASALVRYYA
jgi:hypothetical protein